MKIYYKDNSGEYHEASEIVLLLDDKDDISPFKKFFQKTSAVLDEKWDSFGHEHFKDSEYFMGGADVLISRNRE